MPAPLLRRRYLGFTTATDDAVAVVKAYIARRPVNNTLQPFLANLTALKRAQSSSVSTLQGFCGNVSAVGDDPWFQAAQEDVGDRVDWQPAMQLAQQSGLSLGISKGQVYDAVVNHGVGAQVSTPPASLPPIAPLSAGSFVPGEARLSHPARVAARQDPFSVDHIFDGAAALAGGTPATGVDEVTWLRAFIKVRTQMLLASGGADAARRMKFYSALLDAGDLELDGERSRRGKETKGARFAAPLQETDANAKGQALMPLQRFDGAALLAATLRRAEGRALTAGCPVCRAGPIHINKVVSSTGWTITNVYYGNFEIQ